MDKNEVLSIPVGTPIIHHNEWIGFDTNIFKGQFLPLTAEEVRGLIPGQEIYINADPLHSDGKLVGRIKVYITAIELLDSGELCIHCSGAQHSCSTITVNGVHPHLEKAVDEKILAELIRSVPESKIVHLY